MGGQARGHFYVTLYSNAFAGFPDNTPGNFGNQLAESISLPRAAGWQVALHSLTCSNLFKNDVIRRRQSGARAAPTHNLSQIIVHCPDLGVSYDTRRLLSCHSRRPYDEFNVRVHRYEPKTLLFFPLNVDRITSLRIQLLNGGMQPLEFRRTQPTVCVLQFKKVIPEMYLPIWAHSAGVGAAKVEGNRASDFRVQLPPSFVNSSDQKWEIALTSFSFIPNFDTVPSHLQHSTDSNIFHAIDLSDDTNVFLNEIQQQNLHIPSEYGTWDMASPSGQANWPRPTLTHEPVTLKADRWRKIVTKFNLVYTLQSLFETFHIFKTNIDLADPKSGDPLFLLNFIGKNKKRVALRFKVRSVLYMPVYVAYCLGFRGHATTSDGTLAVFAGDTGDTIVARRNVDVKALTPHSLSLWCDFIEPTFVGGVRSPILKTFAVTRRESVSVSSVTYEPKNLEFHPLNTRELHGLHIRVISADGNEVDFFDPYQNVIVGLVLKTK